MKKISLSFISLWVIMCTKVKAVAAQFNTEVFYRTETSYGARDAITPNIISVIWNLVQLFFFQLFC